eukprot:13876786-Alexandrium_andersonii.AAC.1
MAPHSTTAAEHQSNTNGHMPAHGLTISLRQRQRPGITVVRLSHIATILGQRLTCTDKHAAGVGSIF